VVHEATWVDLPGYGYATASKKEKSRWSRLIADYCEKREALWGIIWLCDIRHPGASMDTVAAPWIADLQLPVLQVLTKADKLSGNKRQQHAARYRRVFGFDRSPVLYSTMDQGSRTAFWGEYNAWFRAILKRHEEENRHR
jgi:GTP-binding protein